MARLLSFAFPRLTKMVIFGCSCRWFMNETVGERQRRWRRRRTIDNGSWYSFRGSSWCCFSRCVGEMVVVSCVFVLATQLLLLLLFVRFLALYSSLSCDTSGFWVIVFYLFHTVVPLVLLLLPSAQHRPSETEVLSRWITTRYILWWWWKIGTRSHSWELFSRTEWIDKEEEIIVRICGDGKRRSDWRIWSE